MASLKSKLRPLPCSQSPPQLSKNELDRITEVFKMYETGLREATIYPKVRDLLQKKFSLMIIEKKFESKGVKVIQSNIESKCFLPFFELN